MGTTSYYYIVEKKDKKNHDRLTRFNTTDLRPCTPPLDRAPTPTSISSPPTPTFSPSSPVTLKSILKQSPRQVNFTLPMDSSNCRDADQAERSVMRAFHRHALSCNSCTDAVRSLGTKASLCNEGFNLVKDLHKYFRIIDGKAISRIDESQGQPRKRVEVPFEYTTTSTLFEAINRGFVPSAPSRSSKKPVVHQSPTRSASRPIPMRHSTIDSYPSHRQNIDDGAYEVEPSNSNSRRQRNNVYRHSSGRFIETRTPFDDAEYAETRTKATPRTVTEQPAASKPATELDDADVESKTSSGRSSKHRRRHTSKEHSSRKRGDSESRRSSRVFEKGSSNRPLPFFWI